MKDNWLSVQMDVNGKVGLCWEWAQLARFNWAWSLLEKVIELFLVLWYYPNTNYPTTTQEGGVNRSGRILFGGTFD